MRKTIHHLAGVDWVETATHINKILPGDTVLHDGQVRTVSKTNLSPDSFVGRCLFGDCYHLGRKPVKRLTLLQC